MSRFIVYCSIVIFSLLCVTVSAQDDAPTLINPGLRTLGKPVNTGEFSEFAPTISADGNTLIFESDKSGRWRLYISTQVNGVWSAPKDMDVINNRLEPGDFIGGPCFSYDGNRLYFTSNMKGTVGGMDLWYSEKINDVWQAPKNMGRTVNTGGYDGFPSVSPDNKTLYFMRAGNATSPTGQRCCILMIAEKRGNYFINPKALPAPVNSGCEGYPRIMADGKTLIFSSFRTGGKGGYDLYQSKKSGSKWGAPVAMEFINTPKDDELISVPASGDVIYLSNTNKNNKDDIYKLPLPKEFQPEEVVLVEGTVKNEATNKPMPATIRVSNIKTKEQIFESENDSITGKYNLYLQKGKKYDVSVTSKGYSFQSEVYDLEKAGAYQKVKKDMMLEPLKLNASFRLNNLFFDFDSASLTKESELELDRVIDMMKTNSTMQVEISAHTDDMGSDAYNLKLSQLRAESVVRYLTLHGIDASRLVAKGYGEAMPSVPNDTDDNRAKNRRVEFKIIKL
ncbi:OmpA family protein [Cytophaga aurantiaca]|uniref:OmpA family protein n=1 Tax=Cytophaga aurantiaca TaxID=29530 RepID=UPI0003787763|nr:OmpA family protein [Cytophaga aurantiaca]